MSLARDDGARQARAALYRAVIVAPFDDRGVAELGKEQGDGFAIFIGEWRLGWWPTRADACEVAGRLVDAIEGYR